MGRTSSSLQRCGQVTMPLWDRRWKCSRDETKAQDLGDCSLERKDKSDRVTLCPKKATSGKIMIKVLWVHLQQGKQW
jgi:hypothetical protein